MAVENLKLDIEQEQKIIIYYNKIIMTMRPDYSPYYKTIIIVIAS